MHQFSNAREVYLWYVIGTEDAPNRHYNIAFRQLWGWKLKKFLSRQRTWNSKIDRVCRLVNASNLGGWRFGIIDRLAYFKSQDGDLSITGRERKKFMKSLRSAAFLALFGVVWLLAVAPRAYGHVDTYSTCAYIDPGIGSFMIQIIIGSVLGSMLVLKIFWYRITGFVGRLFGRKPSQVVAEPQAEVQDGPEQQEGSQDG